MDGWIPNFTLQLSPFAPWQANASPITWQSPNPFFSSVNYTLRYLNSSFWGSTTSRTRTIKFIVKDGGRTTSSARQTCPVDTEQNLFNTQAAHGNSSHKGPRHNWRNRSSLAESGRHWGLFWLSPSKMKPVLTVIVTKLFLYSWAT